MSWSISAIGKASKVAEKLTAQFANIKCSEPEETIKNNAAAAILLGLSVYPANTVVKVDASGSQSMVAPSTGGDSPATYTNNLKVEMTPVYGFIE
jgi:hypothetical protein